MRTRQVDVDVVIEHNHARFDAERFAPFWAAFSHAVRNAVDHGLESSEERERKGKPVRGQIRLRTIASASEQLVQIDDDGRGIDWEAVRKRASEQAVPRRRARIWSPRSSRMACPRAAP